MTDILLALISALLLATLCAWLGQYLGTRNNIASNSQMGVSEHQEGVLPRLADAGWMTRYLLVKPGSDAQHVNVIAALTDEPLGVCVDGPFAQGDYAATRMLDGVHKGTQTAVANGAIALGVDIYSDGTGKVMPEPIVAGSYWLVGRTCGPSAAVNSGDMVEFAPCRPLKVVVIAALTSAQAGGAPSQANFNALQADVAALATAMAHPALIKHL